MKEINRALVEGTRPAMYTAMKYWGKKPHNIWSEYINTYSEEGDVILDPFSGSAVAAFEAVRINRKAIALDLNPMTSFMIEVFSTEFNIEEFTKAANNIFRKINNDETYKIISTTTCKKCGYGEAHIQHNKWNNGDIYESGIECPNCEKRYLVHDDNAINKKMKAMDGIEIPYWYPNSEFHDSPSFTNSFIKNIGGPSFDNLWTKRNLYVLSFIFHEILAIEDENIKKQLLLAFIKIVHLSSKMCVPRSSKSNRAFSTSWGRSAYICSVKQMEMNPLLLFKKNCFGKQSVESALKSVKSHIGKVPSSVNIKDVNDLENSNYDIIYGKVDIKNLTRYIEEKSIDFIITDPPYGGLIQYLDLSLVWLVWLRQYNSYYHPNIEKEITIKDKETGLSDFQGNFTEGLIEVNKVLKDKSKLVFTFNNKEISIWNAFLNSIDDASFTIENVIHQQNKRSGESNVSDKYGTSSTDFYIRCIKNTSNSLNGKTTKQEFQEFVINSIVKIINDRNEPTPYQIIFNGLLSNISLAGFDLEDYDTNIKKIMDNHLGSIFTIIKSEDVHAEYWWLEDKYLINKNMKSLTEKVDLTIKMFFEKNQITTTEEILDEIFTEYANHLAPDINKVFKTIDKYGLKENGNWKYKGGLLDVGEV